MILKTAAVIVFWWSTTLAADWVPPQKTAVAPLPPRVVLHVGAQIEVQSYNGTKDVYVLILTNEPAVGPNYATPEALAKAIGFQGNADAFAHQRGQMIGSEYTLTHDLPLLYIKEYMARHKKP